MAICHASYKNTFVKSKEAQAHIEVTWQIFSLLCLQISSTGLI